MKAQIRARKLKKAARNDDQTYEEEAADKEEGADEEEGAARANVTLPVKAGDWLLDEYDMVLGDKEPAVPEDEELSELSEDDFASQTPGLSNNKGEHPVDAILKTATKAPGMNSVYLRRSIYTLYFRSIQSRTSVAVR